MAEQGDQDKSRRLQSLDQDVLAVQEDKQQQNAAASGAARQQTSAPAGTPATTGGGGGSGTGMVVTVSILSVLLIFTIAAGVLYGLYMHEQMQGLDEGPDIAGKLAPLEQRITELENRVQTLSASDDDGGGSVSGEVLERLEALEGRMAQVRSDIDTVQGRVGDVAQRSKSALSTAEQASTAVNSLEQNVSTHGSRLDDLSNRIAELGSSSDQDDVGSQVQHLNGRVEKLSDDIDSIYRILESR
jgi:archaellum component FlaC